MLADLIANLKTKYIIWGILGMLGLIVLITGLSGGFVLVRSSSEDVVGFSQRTNVTDAAKEPLSIGKGSWKLVFLGVGDYHIEFSSGNKKTLYQPSVGMFSFQNLDVTLHDQAQSQSLGFQNTDCLSTGSGPSQLAFYSCNKSIDNQRTVSLTEDGYNFKDTPSGNTVASYKDGLLQVDDFSTDESATLSATRYSQNTASSSDTNTTFKPSFGSSRLITDTNDTTNSRFVYYDQETDKVYLFKDLHDTPRELEITKYAERKEGFSLDFILDGDTLYVYNGMKYESGLGFGDDKAVTSSDTEGQSIMMFGFDSLGHKENFSLPANLLVEHIAGNNGSLAFSAYTIDTNKAGLYTLSPQTKEPRLAFYAQTLDTCFGGTTLYYLSNDNAVYTYDISKRASFLAYESQNHNPVNLNCEGKVVSFPSQVKEGGNSDYTWTSLSNTSLSANQTRTEDLFPIIDDTVSRISYAYVFKDILYVVLDGDGVCGEVDNETRNATLSYLKDLGINPADFVVKMNYNC